MRHSAWPPSPWVLHLEEQKPDHMSRTRYLSTSDPVATDGRNVDTDTPEVWDRVPATSNADTTYYDRPMLKPSVWSIDIPIYYFLGGAAGAALALGAALQLVAPSHRQELRRFSATCHWIGIIGSSAGAGFLIHDLGRPARFLYMVRVFRPTSPMNVGAWILSGAAPTAIATGLFLNSPGILGRVGEICGFLSGIFGAALATYTGVLVSTTAVPIWCEACDWMPVLFAASGAASAGSMIDIFYDRKAGRRVASWFGTAGRLGEIGSSLLVERAVSAVPKVGEPLHRGWTAVLWKTATALTVASVVISLFPGSSRRKRVARGILGAAGSLCMRFAVHYVADASARDPRAVIQQQRASSGRVA